MLKRQWLLAALVAASISALPVPASAAVGIYLDVAPPAPRVEVVPAPRAGFVWAPGFWDWRNGRHAWVRGHWVRERHGMFWHPDRWEQHEGRWVLQRGAWNREEWRERHEGVPTRNDRDGDGVPNRLDRAPDNPRRQ